MPVNLVDRAGNNEQGPSEGGNGYVEEFFREQH